MLSLKGEVPRDRGNRGAPEPWGALCHRGCRGRHRRPTVCHVGVPRGRGGASPTCAAGLPAGPQAELWAGPWRCAPQVLPSNTVSKGTPAPASVRSVHLRLASRVFSPPRSGPVCGSRRGVGVRPVDSLRGSRTAPPGGRLASLSLWQLPPAFPPGASASSWGTSGLRRSPRSFMATCCPAGAGRSCDRQGRSLGEGRGWQSRWSLGEGGLGGKGWGLGGVGPRERGGAWEGWGWQRGGVWERAGPGRVAGRPRPEPAGPRGLRLRLATHKMVPFS